MGPHRISGDCTTFHLTTMSGKKMQIKLIVHLSGAPKASSIEDFSRFMKEKGVTDILCFCKPTYDHSIFNNYAINFHNLEFDDGASPSKEVIDKFDSTIDEIFNSTFNSILTTTVSHPGKQNSYRVININMHCQAGIGRAPTLLAYIMISRFAWDPFECIDMIRNKRRGCFNKKQAQWIIESKIKKKQFRIGLALSQESEIKDTDKKKSNMCVIV
jgi:protein tyrosine phosphatase type IVA